MAKVFTADNPANPIQLVNIKPKNPGKYYYQHMGDNLQYQLTPDFQTKKCYFQKFTTQDSPVIQILSDYDTIEIKLYDIQTELLEQTFSAIEVPTLILNETFKCYQAEINFGTVPEGEYQLVVSYIDEADEEIFYYSEPISIKEVHENTVLIEYANSENAFSMILDTGYIGQIRVEAAILNFKPGSDDVIYNDQERNSTTLYSLPFRQFQFFLGDAEGLPDWIIDKVNRAFSFNILSLDGKTYNKLDGAKFEEKRLDLYPFSGQVIDIMPVENGFLKRLNTSGLIPEDSDEDMIQYQKLLKYTSNAANISISGIFGNGRLLEKICIINRGIDFDLTVKTASTGGYDDFEITEPVTGITTTITLDQLFNTDKVINLTGLTGIDTDVYIWYKDSLAKKAGVANGYMNLGVNAVVIYEAQTLEMYEIDFNFGTGLGRQGTQWEGWAICDGRNGTQDRGGRFPMGFKDTTGGLFKGLINNIGGGFNIVVGLLNLPRFRVKLFSNTNNGNFDDPPTATSYVSTQGTGGSNFEYRMRKSTTQPSIGLSSEIGGDQAIDHKQPYIVSLFVKKIAEVA